MNGFAGVYGNEALKRQLENSISNGSLQHAIILAGDKGIGKKTLARAFILELFSDKGIAYDDKSRFDNSACRKIIAGNHPDVIYISHEKPAVISIDDIRRQVIDTVYIRPFESSYKVYVIPDAALMTQQAQNAFLKTLEEPPEYVIFILLASDEKQLLDTVRSRAVLLKMKPLTDSVIRKYLIEEFGAEDDKRDICVAFSKGNLGKAIELYQSEVFSEWYQRLMKIVKNIRRMDASEIRIETARLIKVCPDLFEALDLLELWYRDLTLYMVTKDMNGLCFYGESRTLMSMASTGNCAGVQEIMERIDVCRERLRAHVNPELSLELLFLTMREK